MKRIVVISALSSIFALSAMASCHSGSSCEQMGQKFIGQARYSVAAKYFKKACDYGNKEGCNNLAFLYADAMGVKQSYTLAYKYWGKACRMGSSLACSNLQLAKDKVAAMHRRKHRKR